MTFEPFPKMPRLNRQCVITEKIDGTNAQVHILEDPLHVAGGVAPLTLASKDGLVMLAGSSTRYITPGKQTDNYGFAAWVKEHADALFQLGVGRHYGEWWGSGINRGYGLTGGERRFSLFNVSRWSTPEQPGLGTPTHPATLLPDVPGLGVVPVIAVGPFTSMFVENWQLHLREVGSFAAPGFKRPEGIVIWHEASRGFFKITLEGDEEGKEARERRLAHDTRGYGA